MPMGAEYMVWCRTRHMEGGRMRGRKEKLVMGERLVRREKLVRKEKLERGEKLVRREVLAEGEILTQRKKRMRKVLMGNLL